MFFACLWVNDFLKTASSSDVWATKTASYSHSLDTMFLASSYKPPTPKLQVCVSACVLADEAYLLLAFM